MRDAKALKIIFYFILQLRTLLALGLYIVVWHTLVRRATYMLLYTIHLFYNVCLYKPYFGHFFCYAACIVSAPQRTYSTFFPLLLVSWRFFLCVICSGEREHTDLVYFWHAELFIFTSINFSSYV